MQNTATAADVAARVEDAPEIMTTDAVAALLKLTPDTLLRWHKDGCGPSHCQPSGTLARYLSANEWLQYFKGTHFYPVADTTLRTMVGLATCKDPKCVVPPRLEPMLNAAALDGRALEVVTTDLLRELLSDGRVCAALDFPAHGATPTSTPHLSIFHAEDILDGRMGTIGPASPWLLPDGRAGRRHGSPHRRARAAAQRHPDTEQRMNALGATMILSGQRRNEAVETASTRHPTDTATLQSAIRTLASGVRTLLTWASDWVQPGEVVVEFNKDPVSATISPQLVSALLPAVNAGALSRQSFLDILHHGELIDHPAMDELDLIEEKCGSMGVVEFPRSS